MRLLAILTGLCAHVGKLYCFPSQEKILELLRKRYSVDMSRRSLNRHLGALARDFYIQRVRRHCQTRGATGRRLVLHSTLYKLTGRAMDFCNRYVRAFIVPAKGAAVDNSPEPVDNSPPKMQLFAVPFLAQHQSLLLRPSCSTPPSSGLRPFGRQPRAA